MMWTEGYIHVVMRRLLKKLGWSLIAGEYPGGTDHELYPLNVVDRIMARDHSPDPRRHSLGELIPDLVALKGDNLLIAEAKVAYNDADRLKLAALISERRHDLHAALEKFADERHVPALVPLARLRLHPVLVFAVGRPAPTPAAGFSHFKIIDTNTGFFEGELSDGIGHARIG